MRVEGTIKHSIAASKLNCNLKLLHLEACSSLSWTAWLSLSEILFYSLLAGVWLNCLLILKSYQLFRFPCHHFKGFSVFPFYFYPLSLLSYLIFFKPATYKECELPSAQTKQRLDQMWPPICWMGNKYKEWSRLPSVDAESSRACLAFQQGFPRWEIEREKAFVSFFPFPDLTAPLSRVQRKRGHLAMKLWQLLSKRWSSINKLYFAFQGLLWPLLSGIEHLIARVVRNAAEQQILFFPIPSQGFFCCCCYVFFVLFFSGFLIPECHTKGSWGKLKVMRQVLAAGTNKKEGFLLDVESWSYMSETIWFTFSERDGCNRTSCPGDIDTLTWTLLSPALIAWTVPFCPDTWHQGSNFLLEAYS